VTCGDYGEIFESFEAPAANARHHFRMGLSHADKCRAGELKWRSAPPGMSAELAASFMAELRAGRTLRYLTSGHKRPAVVTPERFKKHCELNPRWGRLANKLARANAKAADVLKSPKLYLRLCKYGHPLDSGRIYFRYGYECRRCLKCDQLRNARAGIIKPADLAKATLALRNGSTLTQILKAVEVRNGRRARIINTSAFYRYRSENPEFNRVVRDAIEQRICPAINPVLAVAAGTFKYEWDPADHQLISGMLPPGFPEKDAVINEVIISLLEGRLHRGQIAAKVQWYIKAHYRMFPTKFATFGNAKLVSLDEVFFEDGSRTRGDMVSRGLWD
jgi:hypothetical protein